MEPPPSSDPGPIGPEPEIYHRGRNRKPSSGAVAGAVVTAGAAWAFLRWKPSRILIEGGSMAPMLAPGDQALVITPPRYERDDVVVVEHPGRPGYEMVKRLTGVPGDRVTQEGRILGAGEYWVAGDFAAASTDSRQFGSVTADELKARVVLVYWPKDRRRRVR
jgi:mitochondrial inner membrane protease subunit 1